MISGTLRIKRKDGRVIECKMREQVFHTEDGLPSFIFCVFDSVKLIPETHIRATALGSTSSSLKRKHVVINRMPSAAFPTSSPQQLKQTQQTIKERRQLFEVLETGVIYRTRIDEERIWTPAQGSRITRSFYPIPQYRYLG